MNLHIQVLQLQEKVEALIKRLEEVEKKLEPKPLPTAQVRKAG